MLNVRNYFSGFLFVLLVGILPSVSFSQDRCGTVEYSKIISRQSALPESEQRFERWLKSKMDERKSSGVLRTQSTYTIPVVVHVIHNGESIGSGFNISDAQIASQLSVLNKDFKRLNADAANTPAEFLPLAGNIDIDFVLAKQDPEGLATTGIVRVVGSQSSWTINDNYKLKSTSYWPSENYLNIWVCNITDYLGYAQFPESSLNGLENASKNKYTDGVVIAAEAFGSIDDGPFSLDPVYNKGRTATHEVAHFFGLRHIWGDDSNTCTGSDYVDDTPNQSGSTNGCPSHPRSTCTVNSMFQNYLDYTNDACMNIFTVGQVSRMATVVENSLRRKSLLTSAGSQNPISVANDLGIRKILDPTSGECGSASITPTLDVRNYGTNTITSFRIRLRKDGVITETKDFSIALNLLDATTVTFAPISYSTGNHSITFEILLTNGIADGNSANNIVNQSIAVPFSTATPIAENFNFAVPPTWSIINPDQVITWTHAVAPSTSATNKALKLDFYNYIDNIGEIDLFVTPVFDLSTAPVALLKFDVSYPKFSNDELRVIALTGCNSDINQGTVVYAKKGSNLATSTSSSPAYVPGGPSDWRNEIIDLTAFIGQSKVQLAFVGFNDYGNNLYLDNISVLTTLYEDVKLSTIISPAPVMCPQEISPRLLIINNGTAITSFNVQTTLGGNTTTTAFTGVTFDNNKLEIELPPLSLTEGESVISFTVTEPNGVADKFPADNTKAATIVVNSPEDYVPLREGFENSFEELWTIANPTQPISWQTKSLGSNQALFFNAFNSSVTGDEAWLVSPVLDFTDLTQARIFYDLSYAYRSNTFDRFRILTSSNCGESFDATPVDLTGSAISTETSETAWIPSSEGDWQRRKSVNLTALAGEPNVRVAFVFTNGNGNNIYLDNIEILPSSDPSPPQLEDLFSIYPNPAKVYNETFITFNIPQREDISITLIDAMGKELSSAIFPNALNQTYPLSLQHLDGGLYLVRVQSSDKIYVQKLIIVR